MNPQPSQTHRFRIWAAQTQTSQAVIEALLEGVPLNGDWEPSEPGVEAIGGPPTDAFMESLKLEAIGSEAYCQRSQGLMVILDLLANKRVKEITALVVKDATSDTWELARIAIPLDDLQSIQGIIGTAAEWLCHARGEDIMRLHKVVPGWSIWE